MSRDDGFAVADVDSAYLGDQKLKNLWRALGDQDRMSRAVLLHMATLLESWRTGVRATVAESVPLWLHPDPELVAALQKAHLLDPSGRIPIRSWKGWHDAAAARRQVLRDRWNRANAKRVKGPNAVTARSPRGSSAATATPGPSGPDRTVRTVPPVPRRDAPAREMTPTWFDAETAHANGTNADLGDVQQWLAKERSVSVPDGGGLVELARLVDQHGAPAVIEALAVQDRTMRDGRQYVFGAMKRLNPLPTAPKNGKPETDQERQLRELTERQEARERAKEEARLRAQGSDDVSDFRATTKAGRELLERLDTMDWAELWLELGEPDNVTTVMRGGGREWAVGNPRPALATDEVAAIQAMARCVAWRASKRLEVNVLGGIHPRPCSWCVFPTAEVTAAVDWAGRSSGLIELQYATWRGSFGSHYDRATPQQGTYTNARWAAFFGTAPSRDEAGRQRRSLIEAAMYGGLPA